MIMTKRRPVVVLSGRWMAENETSLLCSVACVTLAMLGTKVYAPNGRKYKMKEVVTMRLRTEDLFICNILFLITPPPSACLKALGQDISTSEVKPTHL